MASVAGGIVEYMLPGDTFTMQANGAVTGGLMVEGTGTSGDAQLAADSSIATLGVAMHSAADNAKLTVARHGIFYLKASGAVNAGDQVACATSGTIKAVAAASTATSATVNAARSVIGVALDDIADTERGRVVLRL